jgi:outer membrane protein TolC
MTELRAPVPRELAAFLAFGLLAAMPVASAQDTRPEAGQGQSAVGAGAAAAAPAITGQAAPQIEWKREPKRYKTELRLSLEEAIRLGLANNLDIKLSRLDDQIRNRELIIAKAAFDPFFNLGSSYAKNRDPSVSFFDLGSGATQGVRVSPSETLSYYTGVGGRWFLGTTYDVTLAQVSRDRPIANQGGLTFLNPIISTDISASIRQPLLKGAWYGVNMAEVRIAENNRQVSREQLLLTAMTTVFAIERAYWELLFAIRNYDAKTKALDVTVENLENVRKKRAVGTLAAIDVTTAESQAAIRSVELDEAEQTRELTRDQLLRLINYSKEQSLKEAWEDGRRIGPFDDIMIHCTTQPDEGAMRLDRDAALVAAFNNRPEYRQNQLYVENQTIRLDVAKNDLLPALDILGRWTQLGLEDSFDESMSQMSSGKYYDWEAGVQISIPLGNRGARSVYRNTRDELRKLKVSKADLETAIVLEVDQGIRRIKHLERKVEDLDERVRLQQELLRAERRKLDVGMSIPYTVSVIENDLVDSVTQALLAKANLNTAKAQLWLATGEILYHHKIVVEGPGGSE